MASPTAKSAHSEFKSCNDIASSDHDLNSSQNFSKSKNLTNGGDSSSPLLGYSTTRSSNRDEFLTSSVQQSQPLAGQVGQRGVGNISEPFSNTLNHVAPAHHTQNQLNLLKRQTSTSGQSGRATPNFLTSTHSINYFDKPEFETKLCSCCQNSGLCLVGLICYPIPLGLSAVASKFFKSRFLASLAGCFCPCLMLCGIRENARKMMNINGTVVGDCCSSFCCCCCLNCQLARELGLYD